MPGMQKLGYTSFYGRHSQSWLPIRRRHAIILGAAVASLYILSFLLFYPSRWYLSTSTSLDVAQLVEWNYLSYWYFFTRKEYSNELIRGDDRRNIIVSFVLCAEKHMTGRCRSNTDVFFSRAIVNDPRVYFIVTSIVEEIPLSREMIHALRVYPNLNIRFQVPSERDRVRYHDLHVHGRIMREFGDSKTTFILLNCHARGPYYPLIGGVPDYSWIKLFTSKLKDDVKLVGASVSCAGKPHVQAHAMVLDSTAVQLIAPIWSENGFVLSRSELLVAASESILKRGYNFAATDLRHEGRDWRVPQICDPEFNHLPQELLDPTYCNPNEQLGPACLGQEPCEVMFLKHYDGAPSLSISTMWDQDGLAKPKKKKRTPKLCIWPTPKPRKFFNTRGVFNNLVDSYKPFGRVFGHWETQSNFAILVRAHESYALQMMAMILTLEAFCSRIGNMRLLVIVVPTEFSSVRPLQEHVAELDRLDKIPRKVRVKVLDAPKQVYDEYSYLLNGTLCTPQWHQYFLSRKFDPKDVSRWCNINSPLHYKLVDLALYYVLDRCLSCELLLTTNADNNYSEKFFKEVVNGYADNDIVMTDMATKGKYFPVRAARAEVDLGAYAVRVDFLRRTNTTFFSSLPMHPHARDYHDSDGHFIAKLVVLNARVKHIRKILFFHN